MGYSNGILESDEKGGSGERGEQGLPGIGFKLTDDGNFDIDGKRLTDVSKPVDGGDATTKAYVDGEIGHHTGNMYHLRQSFTFYDSSGAELALSTDSITGLLTDYKHGYYKIPKSGDDNYFSTLDIKIRNNLPQSTYSALFYLYGYRNNSIMSGVDLGPILFGVDGTNYNILKYDDDDTTETRNHTKGIIWFTSDGRAGSIELGFRFFDKSITHFVILSRCVEGKVNLGFSSNIFNVSSTVGNVPLYFEDLNMNRRSIKNLGGPTDDGDVTNKKYVGVENAKQDIAINDKASKSDLVNFSSINTGLGYNNPAKSSFSYVMINRPYSRENEKNFVFDGSVVSSIANTASNANSTTLTIPYKGKYKLILKEELPITGDSSLKIDLSWTESSGIKTKNVYSENFSLPPGAMIYFNPYELNFDLFVDYENSNLKIYVTGRIHFGGNAPNFPAFFGLYLDSDVLRKREAVKKYLKLNGNNKMKSDLDIDGNHILKVENLTDYKDSDPLDYRIKDSKSVVNKEYLNSNFLKRKNKDGKDYWDSSNIKISKGPIYNNDGSTFTEGRDYVTKDYVDDEISKASPDLSGVLKLNENNPPSFDAGGYGIINLAPFKEADNQQDLDAQKNNAITFGFFKDYTDKGCLQIDGTNSMKANISMLNPDGTKHKITGMADPTDDDDASTKKYVDDSDNKILYFIQDFNPFPYRFYDFLHNNTNKFIFSNPESRYFQIPPSDNTKLIMGLVGRYSILYQDMFKNTGKVQFKITNIITSENTIIESENISENSWTTKTIRIEFYTNSTSILEIETTGNLLLRGQGSEIQNFGLNIYANLARKNDLNTLLDIAGTRNMAGNLNLGLNYITNLKKPNKPDKDNKTELYAVNAEYVRDRIDESEAKDISSISKENVFQKVMDDGLFIEDDDDISRIGVVDKDLHKVNKKTYHFQINYDSDIGYYSTRLGINIIYLPIGYYIIAFEMIFSDKIDGDNITINCQSTYVQIISKNTQYYSDHSRSVFCFRKGEIQPFDDELDIDISLKNKSGESYEPKTDIYVLVYGVTGLGTDVDTRIWDRYYYINDNNDLQFEVPVDMNNKDIENVNDLSINNELNMNNRQIKKLGDGNENSDAVNVKQLNEMETNVTKYVTDEFGKVNPVLRNNSDFIKFIYRNLIRNDSKSLLIKELYFPDSVQGRTQNNYTYQTNGDNKGDVTFYLTFVHKATTSDNMMIALHWEAGRPIYIFVSKSSVVASENLLIDDPSLKSYRIPSYYIGKQVYLWITIKNDLIQINFSGSRAISVTHPFIFHKDANLRRIDVSDSPFTIQRGLITKNIYNVDSVAYGDVREYEISEGTFVSAV